MLRPIAIATLIAGTLDILMAIVSTAVAGGSVARMLGGIASGPFGGAIRDSAIGAPVGLAVHFALMAVIVTVFMLAARSAPALRRFWWIAGPVYGLAVFLVMYGVVLPARFEGAGLPTDGVELAKALFAHCVLVGLPIAWIAARSSLRD